jgi:hypothetical protein
MSKTTGLNFDIFRTTVLFTKKPVQSRQKIRNIYIICFPLLIRSETRPPFFDSMNEVSGPDFALKWQ